MTMHYLIFLKGHVRWQMEVSYPVGIKKKKVQVLPVAHVHFRASLISVS